MPDPMGLFLAVVAGELFVRGDDLLRRAVHSQHLAWLYWAVSRAVANAAMKWRRDQSCRV
jgi:hypothetical protein